MYSLLTSLPVGLAPKPIHLPTATNQQQTVPSVIVFLSCKVYGIFCLFVFIFFYFFFFYYFQMICASLYTIPAHQLHLDTSQDQVLLGTHFGIQDCFKFIVSIGICSTKANSLECLWKENAKGTHIYISCKLKLSFKQTNKPKQPKTCRVFRDYLLSSPNSIFLWR